MKQMPVITYDGALPKTITIAGPVPGNVGITYDNFFRVQQLGINGQNTSYGYDNDGLLTQAGALTLNRDANNGLLTGTTLDNIKTEQEYDKFGLLKRLTAKLGSTVLFSETFTRDKLGRVEEKTTTTGGPLSTYRYAYDASGRLSDVFKNGALQNHYEYDANGNRTLADGIAASYDAQDRLKTFGTASYGFSANGELQTESTVAGNNTFSYDVYGNLKQVTLASGGKIDYLVDGQNRRIGKKVNGVLTQGWVYQDQLKPIAELDGNGQIVSRFIYAGKANVPEYMVKGVATYRLVTDTLGSVRQVVDSQTGQVMQELEYDAWGKVLADSNPGFQPFGYAGGLYDNNTGLVRFGARDYDAKTARWTAKDPIRFNGGDSNIFSYVGGNPINFIDPSGLAACGVRTPDFINFQIDAYIFSVWGTFSRDGNSFVGGGFNKGSPNPASVQASVTAGWLNRFKVNNGDTNAFLSGYAGSGAAAFAAVGGGIVYSPGSGTATVLGVGAGVQLGTNFKSSGSLGGGYSKNQGDTGMSWGQGKDCGCK
ncbi:RHS repeat-associated core domain-containing protein [Chitinibacter fontanus]|uniref:RHS repeat-associated core domain-containing protein n=1 Tax=Chitinibacter fontanus TaxID=1737446 RepID=A0A7D5V973_9NEIS|nr:RHS repeat-associated core domain-containing protein [Chitinibacter fontanus]QLI81199.1 RHS repeat-associated core domain-containing protein [Chitinibacter fontanus]